MHPDYVSARTQSILHRMEEDGYDQEEIELMTEYLSQFEKQTERDGEDLD